jgi:hypothetical protein
VKDAAQRSQQRRLSEPWNPLQENVAAAEQADENAVHDVLLANDDFADFAANLIQAVCCRLKICFGEHTLILAHPEICMAAHDAPAVDRLCSLALPPAPFEKHNARGYGNIQ